MYDIIDNKKNKKVLTKEEIHFFVDGYVKNEIPDYQVSALLMAICLNDLNLDEIFYLTEAMINSGDIIDLSNIDGITIDKHSTGGVGDKTSLSLLPMLAACGLKGSKMSGRGLGHTGGTLDKLEAIDGFNINISDKQANDIINENNFIICGQTLNLVPADKKLYALRDVTATVDNIGLIASSIMSKKIASGAKNIILDVKLGSGAFMKDLKSAIKLSETMVSIGERFGKNIRAIITNMDEPLGKSVGNSIEVIEAIETLKGSGPRDFENLCIFLCANLLEMTGIASSLQNGEQIAKEIIDSKKALDRFEKFVELQNGDSRVVKDFSLFKQAKYKADVLSVNAGYVHAINAEMIGRAALIAGAGRETKDDNIDYSAGIVLNKKVNNKVNNADVLATIYTDKENKIEEIKAQILRSFNIGDEKNNDVKLIYGVVTKNGFIPYNN
jgi:pyrimidine-nucleoside phosphorylase